MDLLFTESRKPVWETLLGCIEFELLIRYSCDYISWAFGWSGPEFRAKTHILPVEMVFKICAWVNCPEDWCGYGRGMAQGLSPGESGI